MCVNEEQTETHGRDIEWAYPQPTTFPQTPKAGLETVPFYIAAKRLAIDENINTARLMAHFLALK